jgi:hypothetical protein
VRCNVTLVDAAGTATLSCVLSTPTSGPELVVPCVQVMHRTQWFCRSAPAPLRRLLACIPCECLARPSITPIGVCLCCTPELHCVPFPSSLHTASRLVLMALRALVLLHVRPRCKTSCTTAGRVGVHSWTAQCTWHV